MDKGDGILKFVRRCHTIMSLLPALYVPVLWGYGYCASTYLGHWPFYDHPDPKDMHMKLLHSIVWASMLTSLGALLLWPITAYSFWKRMSVRRFIANTLIFAVAVAAFWAQIRIDPGGLFEWYID
jgi:hypothetical protein